MIAAAEGHTAIVTALLNHRDGAFWEPSRDNKTHFAEAFVTAAERGFPDVIQSFLNFRIGGVSLQWCVADTLSYNPGRNGPIEGALERACTALNQNRCAYAAGETRALSPEESTSRWQAIITTLVRHMLAIDERVPWWTSCVIERAKGGTKVYINNLINGDYSGSPAAELMQTIVEESK